jgi:glutamine synthetase
MTEAQFTGRRQLRTETHKPVWVPKTLHGALAEVAAEEERTMQVVTRRAVEQYIAVKRGELIVTPATPQEDSK